MEDMLNFRFEMRENKDVIFFFLHPSFFFFCMDALNLSTHPLGLSSGPGNHLSTVPALTEPQVDERQEGSRQLDRLEN